jgi:hypothetical protein
VKSHRTASLALGQEVKLNHPGYVIDRDPILAEKVDSQDAVDLLTKCPRLWN